MNFDAYVELTKLTKEEIEKYTLKNKKNNDTSKLSNERNIPTGSIKQEYPDDSSIEIDGTTIEQSLGLEFRIKDEVEDTDVVEVKSEQEDQDIPITEGITFSTNENNVNVNEFCCTICNSNFENFEDTLVHKNLIHKSKPYVCKVCNAQFVLSVHLHVHQAEHDNYLRMRSSHVNPSEIQSSSKSNLTVNPSRNYKNSESTSKLTKKPSNTNTSVNLQQNLSNKFIQNSCVTDPNINLQNTKCKSWKCPNCVFATGSEAKFRNHFDICNNASKSGFKFQCSLCVKSFKTQAALNSHIFRHETISENELVLDNKKLRERGVVKSQRYVSPNVENVNRNYKCKYCDRNFTTHGKLIIHQKQHKQQMICNKCHKTFVLRKNFEKHLLSHKNVIMSNGQSISGTKIIKRTDDKHIKQNILPKKKLFRCSYCNIDYRTKQCLAHHKRQYHYNSTFPRQKGVSTTIKCNWCSVSITKCNLLRHIKNLHPHINPIKCLYCPMAFKNRLSLQLHKSRFHKI